jgi:purine-nucleoside/S-methyl-5'-thioadenosine phosphorylase / adenosine deaminase
VSQAADERLLALSGGAHALFTDRSDGNMSSVGGEEAEHGARDRERLRERLDLDALARGYQVHGATVAAVREMPRPAAPAPGSRETSGAHRRDADGQATNLARLGVMVLAADCLPVAIASEGAVAMLHAGWRGLAAGVLEEGVRALRRLGGGEPFSALIGPGAGACCYEVGEEVHAALAGAARPAGNIDLRAIARERLLAAGVGDIRDVAACTICDERFFSHRREGARAGRQAAIAWLG